MSIGIEGVTKRFGAFVALDRIDLEVGDGELLALLGPSGSGKTTLLRILAGLEAPDAGRVLLQGDDATHRQARERQVGFVFQHYALFRHLTVFENVAFGLRVRPRQWRPQPAEIRERVLSLLGLVQLEGLAQRYPSQLSGGQRQRVALARALAVEPRLLLLDEPFGALDARVRVELRRWLRRLHDELGVTTVFVTHDQDEALELADRVVIMRHGRVEQCGTPDDVYERPANLFVAQFLGDLNQFHGRLRDDLPAGPVGYVRPHDVTLQPEPSAGSVPVRVRQVRPIGPVVRVELERLDNGETLHAQLPRPREANGLPPVGARLHAAFERLQEFLDDYVI